MKDLCGKCNICCIIYRIDKKQLSWRDTDKAKGEVCDKLINDRCVRYKDRPKACRNYECLWLQLLPHNKWPIEYRPDKLGINVTTMRDESDKFIFKIEELEEGKIDFDNLSPEADSFLKSIFELEKQQKGDTQVEIHFFGQNKGHKITQNK